MTYSQFQRDDEPTGRTKLVAEFDIFRSVTERNAKRLRFWAQLVGGALVAVVVACVKVGIYMSDIAHKGQVDALTSRQLVVETKVDMLTAMIKTQGEQMRSVAKAVRAPVIAPQLQIGPAVGEEVH